LAGGSQEAMDYYLNSDKMRGKQRTTSQHSRSSESVYSTVLQGRLNPRKYKFSLRLPSFQTRPSPNHQLILTRRHPSRVTRQSSKWTLQGPTRQDIWFRWANSRCWRVSHELPEVPSGKFGRTRCCSRTVMECFLDRISFALVEW
jgi:hypothetical protein